MRCKSAYGENKADHSKAGQSRAEQDTAQHMMQHFTSLHVSTLQHGCVVAHRLKTMRMVAAALVGTKDSQKTPASTVGRALCSLCALGQLSISTYRLGLPVSWSKACRQATGTESVFTVRSSLLHAWACH